MLSNNEIMRENQQSIHSFCSSFLKAIEAAHKTRKIFNIFYINYTNSQQGFICISYKGENILLILVKHKACTVQTVLVQKMCGWKKREWFFFQRVIKLHMHLFNRKIRISLHKATTLSRKICMHRDHCAVLKYMKLNPLLQTHS